LKQTQFFWGVKVRGWEDIFSFFIAASNRSISSQSLSSAVNVGILNETATANTFFIGKWKRL